MAPAESPEFVSLRELEPLARERVPPAAYDYIAGGSLDEATLRENADGYHRWRLVHRVLRDVSARDASTTVLGTPVDAPVLVAPTAFHKLAHPHGETATARGAHAAGTVMVASTLSTTRLEDIAAASPGPKWFQLYIYKDRALTERLVERAEAAGYEALVVTVDAPVWGRRERDVRNGFSLPEGLTLANFADDDKARLPSLGAGGDGLAAYVASQLDPALTWEDVAWLRDLTDLPVVVKGVAHPDDARRAAEAGCAGVVVSNHGGRQLDRGVATVDALPAVADAVGDELEVYVDGGVRRGTDVLIALALGARAVLVGRPVLWALAVGGAAGVERALGILRDEFDNALALAGLARAADATRDALHRSPPPR